MATLNPSSAIAVLVPTAEQAAGAPLGGGPDLTRYALVCAGMLVAILALAWILRRVLRATLERRAAARSLQIVDVLPLGGKQRLAVVRCYDRTFLLGLGEKEVASITELDAVIAPNTSPPPSRADLSAFARVLERTAPTAPRPEVLRREGIVA